MSDINSDVNLTDINLIVVALKRRTDAIGDENLDSWDSKRSTNGVFQSRHRLPDLFYFSKHYEKLDANHSLVKFILQFFSDYESRICEEESDLQQKSALAQFLSFDNYFHLIPRSLKEKLELTEPSQRLACILNLLIDFHYGYECRIFITLAVKLSLIALDLSKYVSTTDDETVMWNLQGYLQIIQKNRCGSQILATALRVFYVRPEMKPYFFKEVPDLNYIFENIQEAYFCLKKQLNDVEPGRLRNFDVCFGANLEKFVTLVEFGAFSTYSKEDLDIMNYKGVHSNDKVSYPYLFINQPNHLRCYQTFHLFQKHTYGELSQHKAEYLLKLLWQAVPDPYLTEEEIISYVSAITRRRTEVGMFVNIVSSYTPYSRSSTRVFKRFIQDEPKGTWLWYNDAMFNGKTPLKSPRRLYHLSRCAVRKCLANNFQLPSGVKLLNISENISNYLLLKECGCNPFEKNDLAEKYWWLYGGKRFFHKYWSRYLNVDLTDGNN